MEIKSDHNAIGEKAPAQDQSYDVVKKGGNTKRIVTPAKPLFDSGLSV
jgi:hypothetical protein